MNCSMRPYITALPFIRFYFLLIVTVPLMISSGCRTRSAPVAIPQPNREALQYVAEGDAWFRQSHLYGWRQAEASYRKAYERMCSNEIQKKLLLARFLILLRQIDEDIPNPSADAVIHDLCSGDERLKTLCTIAQWYAGKAPQSELQAVLPVQGENAELDAYLNFILSKNKSTEAVQAELKALIEQFKGAPLFLYLDLERLAGSDPAQVETDHAHFAEAFEYIADSLFQKKKYQTARALFQKTLKLIPDYTRALNGLGNICFFALEDYEQALSFYESVLAINPRNTAALFGKGAALHKLERYVESNVALDQMLSGDLAGGAHMGGDAVRYYSGEGCYIKAYNHYLMRDSIQARELLDTAKIFLPDSEEINELSGILFYKEEKLKESHRDFVRVIAKGNSNCTAQLHLGLIYQKLANRNLSSGALLGQEPKEYRENWMASDEPAGKKALNYFLGASSCLQSAAVSLQKQIDSVPTMDLSAEEKVILSGRLQKKLTDHRISSASNIEMMIAAAGGNTIAEKDNYVDLMRKILTGLRILS